MLVKLDGLRICAGDGERKRTIFSAAQRVDGCLHHRATDAVALVTGHHANLRGMADAFRNGGGEHHADRRFARRGPDEE